MSRAVAPKSQHHGALYGAFAYASIVLTCYAGFLSSQRYFWGERMLVVVFVLGGLYSAVGVFAGGHHGLRSRQERWIYYAVQCILLTAMVVLSPIRGFFGIVVLPLMSQAVFDLRWPYSLGISLYLFGLNIAIWAVPYGWSGAVQAVLNYTTGFAFTAVFTVITKRAMEWHAREAKLREEVEVANRLLQQQAAQTEELATTRERNRVAREIHDGVGHYLTVVKTQLDAAAALIPTQPEKALEVVNQAARLASEALDDVRRSVGALRTDAARPPLPEALRALTCEAGLPVTVRVEGEVRSLPPGIEHALFRSAQEGLTNIRKHAAASAAEVALDFRPTGHVTLAVTDNGRGAAKQAGAGFGLVGIRERIEVLGGHVESGNRRDGGFALTIEVPA